LANIYWSGEKSPQEETIKALRSVVPEVWENAFYIRFKERILELMVEVENTDSSTGLWEHFKTGKFMGHQMHILKVPIGYLEGFKQRLEK
tara:strand:- start:3600 stop:3869 length:270 start_codon:yes stop_codon:yes gene_type:complete